MYGIRDGRIIEMGRYVILIVTNFYILDKNVVMISMSRYSYKYIHIQGYCEIAGETDVMTTDK